MNSAQVQPIGKRPKSAVYQRTNILFLIASRKQLKTNNRIGQKGAEKPVHRAKAPRGGRRSSTLGKGTARRHKKQYPGKRHRKKAGEVHREKAPREGRRSRTLEKGTARGPEKYTP